MKIFKKQSMDRKNKWRLWFIFKQLSIDMINFVEDSVIFKIRRKAKDKMKDDIKDDIKKEIENVKIVYNKKIICLNSGIDGSNIVLNFKEDFMDDIVETFTGIYNWMIVNNWDALNLGDGTSIGKDSIEEVIYVMKKLNSKLSDNHQSIIRRLSGN